MSTRALRSRLASVALLLAASAAGTFFPGAANAGGKDGLQLPRVGFACCNLRYEGDWISDGNYAVLPMLPAGTPIKVVSLGWHKAFAEIGGKKMRLGHDYGRAQESLEQWVSKIVVEEDPAPRISSYAADVQAAIKEGRVVLGMTREQAIVAIGYPLTSETPSLDSVVWRHWVSSFEEYQLNWGADGRLADVIAEAPIRNLVLHKVAN
jgi:hypothetical protein